MLRPKAEFSEGECFNLTPVSGNIHCFLAKEDSIFLDVLSPNYSQERPCTFYSIVENSIKKECPHCGDHHRRVLKETDSVEIAELIVDETLPSSEFKDIDIFAKGSGYGKGA